VEELRRALWGDIAAPSEEHIDHHSLLPLRVKPIILVNELAVLSDPVFCLEKLSIGPIFHLLNRPDLLGARDEPLIRFGKACENYCNDILDKTINPQSLILPKRVFPNVRNAVKKGEGAEILDALLVGAEEAVFFHIKARWLRDDCLLTGDASTYQQHLLEKYGRGLEQLVNAIVNLDSGKWYLTEDDINRWKTIYPVLLVHDRFFDAAMDQIILNSTFRELLVPDQTYASQYMTKGRFIVSSLIMMTVSTLEEIESAHFDLIDLLKNYSLNCPDRVISLRNYILKSPYRQKCYPSKFIARNALKTMDSTLDSVFGEIE
jgi:hypothetical protein